MVDQWDPTPIYQQIANLIADQIESGELAPGDRLPSESTLMQTHGVARETVRRAMAELRNRGLIVTIHTRGSFVKPQDPTGISK